MRRAQGISDLAASFVVCRELGRFSFVSGNFLFDEFSGDLGFAVPEKQAGDSAGTSAGSVKLYNLSQGAWTPVGPYVDWKTVGSLG